MKPVKTFRVGLCSASLFRNKAEGNGGGGRAFLTVSVQRRYKKGDSWESASNFGLAELPQVQRAMQLAQQYVEAEEAEV